MVQGAFDRTRRHKVPCALVQGVGDAVCFDMVPGPDIGALGVYPGHVLGLY